MNHYLTSYLNQNYCLRIGEEDKINILSKNNDDRRLTSPVGSTKRNKVKEFIGVRTKLVISLCCCCWAVTVEAAGGLLAVCWFVELRAPSKTPAKWKKNRERKGEGN